MVASPAPGQTGRPANRYRVGGVWLLAGFNLLGTLAVFMALPGDWPDKLRLILSGICPQRPDHTHFIEGRPLPLEARMVGIFAGYGLTIAGLWLVGRGRALQWPRPRLSLALSGLVALMVADGLNATFWDLGWPALYPPQNWLRLLTGLVSGVGMAGLLLPALSLTVWKQAYLRPTFKSWPEIGLALLPGLALWALVLWGWGPLYGPVAWLSAAGVMTMLVMFNLIILTVLLRRENRVVTFGQFALPLTLAWWASLGQLLLFAVLRVTTGVSPGSF